MVRESPFKGKTGLQRVWRAFHYSLDGFREAYKCEDAFRQEALLAAILIGIIGIYWSRWLLAHPKVFTVAAVIPMFPGISAYTAMISAVKISHFGYSEEMMIMLLSNFLKASSIVGALSIGLSIPGLWLYRKRPRV